MGLVAQNRKKNMPADQAIRVIKNAKEWWHEELEDLKEEAEMMEEQVDQSISQDLQELHHHHFGGLAKAHNLALALVHEFDEAAKHSPEEIQHAAKEPIKHDQVHVVADERTNGPTSFNMDALTSQMRVLQEEHKEVKAEIKGLSLRQDTIIGTLAELRELMHSVVRKNMTQPAASKGTFGLCSASPEETANFQVVPRDQPTPTEAIDWNET